jgi:hypothetical protein
MSGIRSSGGSAGHGIASHFEVTINPNDPPPVASEYFTKLRQQATSIWNKFENSENALVRLDDQVDGEVLTYVSAHQQATGQEVRRERSRITQRLYEPAIIEAEDHCEELEAVISSLKEAARREPKTVEGRATLQIDAKVMHDCLVTTRQIIEVAKIQLSKASSRLKQPF